ncbi:IS66 family insertion sequence element accessory protein TnpA, partial [Rhodopirellula bahusiensis]
MTRAETANLWTERLQRFEQAQMTVAQFCAAEGVSQPSFYNWK